jgi:hypothetical protein
MSFVSTPNVFIIEIGYCSSKIIISKEKKDKR